MSDRRGRLNYDYEAPARYSSHGSDHGGDGFVVLVLLFVGVLLGAFIHRLFGSSGGTFSASDMHAFKKVETIRNDVEEVQKIVAPKPPSLPPYYSVSVSKAPDAMVPVPPPPIHPPPNK